MCFPVDSSVTVTLGDLIGFAIASFSFIGGLWFWAKTETHQRAAMLIMIIGFIVGLGLTFLY